ncbi:transposase, partial [Acidiphilium sp. PA]|uniref:transposase n=1 Tax=Acidiphilium sp. PA TaxID=2871705 RepID=UPI0022430B10
STTSAKQAIKFSIGHLRDESHPWNPSSRPPQPHLLNPPKSKCESPVLECVRDGFPWLRHVFADGGYAGDKLKAALEDLGKWTVEIVKRSDAAKGFVLLPRRWVVERTFAWLNRNRRLAKDVEATIESATAWIYIASVKLMSRRLAIA